jgi:8-oxo-dGTP diphosphatase
MLVVAAVIQHKGLVLACRRAEHKSLAGKWEFPGGKVESGETDEEALKREIFEELQIEIEVGVLVAKSRSQSSSIEMHSYYASIKSGLPSSSSDHDKLRWLRVEELSELEWPELDVPVVEMLLAT